MRNPVRDLFLLATLFLTGAVLSACGGESQIIHQLDESEANEILVVLESKGISAAKLKEEGRIVLWTVTVANVEAKDAMRILVANKLPRSRSQGLKEVYPAGGGGLIPTKSEEKAKFLMAIQGEAERKLKTLPGIVQAHVSIVQPDKDVVRDLDTPPPPATASVAIVFNAIDERGTAAVTTEEVKSLVASSVEELAVGNVVVVMKRNVPGQLVETPYDSGTVDAPIGTAHIAGISLSDTASYNKLRTYFVGGVILVIIAIGVGIGGVVRAITLSRRQQRLEAELTSTRKARGTQTGMSPPP